MTTRSRRVRIAVLGTMLIVTVGLAAWYSLRPRATASIQGDWVLEECVPPSGLVLPPGARIDGERIHINESRLPYRIGDASKGHIDLDSTWGGWIPGFYEVSGDRLRIIFATEIDSDVGPIRPASFEVEPIDGSLMRWTFRRKPNE